MAATHLFGIIEVGFHGWDRLRDATEAKEKTKKIDVS